MPCQCPLCQQLIRTGQRHPRLETISHISNSELLKCTLCHAFYLHEHDRWEPLSDYRQSFTHPTATYENQLMQN